MPDPNDRLRTLLGADPPPGVAALDSDAQLRLAELIEDTRRRQSQSLERSFTAAMKHVPFPVRGIIKKVLLG